MRSEMFQPADPARVRVENRKLLRKLVAVVVGLVVVSIVTILLKN